MLLIEFSFLIQNQISYVMSEPSEKAIDNLMEKGFKVIFGQRKWLSGWRHLPPSQNCMVDGDCSLHMWYPYTHYICVIKIQNSAHWYYFRPYFTRYFGYEAHTYFNPTIPSMVSKGLCISSSSAVLAVFRNLQGQEQKPLLSVEMQVLRLQLRTMNQNLMSPWSDLMHSLV